MNRVLMGALLWASASLATAGEPVLFEDHFAGKLGPGWSWIREDAKHWRTTEKALEIRVEPGVAHTVKNALVRKLPGRPKKGAVAAEVTVTFLTPPTNQFEQGGITLYQQGKPVLKLVHERIEGKTYIIPGKVPTASHKVQLRLIMGTAGYSAQFRADAKDEFQEAAKGKLAHTADEQISIQCYNGPPNAEHWIRFEDFRLIEME